MKHYAFDILTPMFSCGASQTTAELRAPEVRGALRWWFRTLGGFTSLSATPLREQERLLFGGLRSKNELGPSAERSALTLRVAGKPSTESVSGTTDYFLWPLRKTSRACLLPNNNAEEPDFSIHLSYTPKKQLDSLDAQDLDALMTVFGWLGALGFRSRRAYGAIAFHGEAPMSLAQALKHFTNPQAIVIKRHCTTCTSAQACIEKARSWLKDWRAYKDARGRNKNTNGKGFLYAKADHDVGLGAGSCAYRPAIGLPIIQRYTSTHRTNHWEYPGEGATRFASPVLLRPVRLDSKNYALAIIFVDAHRWPKNKCARVGRTTVRVSLELYDAMKLDRELISFSC